MRVFEPSHPLVELARGREPELGEPERLILAGEWWNLYMVDFARVASVAAEAKERLQGGERAVITATWFYRALLQRGCAFILGVFPELRRRINDTLDGDVELTRQSADDLLDYLIALGQ